MSDTEIALLKSEVARLNRIITILLEQNEALKARIAIAEKENAHSGAWIATTENGNGNTEAWVAVAENGNGNKEMWNPTSENSNGNTEARIAIAENGNGNTQAWKPVSENVNGNTNLLPPLPENIPPTPGNLSRLYVFLRQQNFGKVRHDSLRNAAALLLHFYNKNGGAYPELKKLTGLSHYGLAKYLRSLKQRGLIERDGWQRFKVTAHAISYLKQAGFGS